MKIAPKTAVHQWDLDRLRQRAIEESDSANWDWELLEQDIDTYTEYTDVFQSYPLNKSPFPVAEYNYAVSSAPFVMEYEGHVFKGVSIGEYEHPESDTILDRLTLLVLVDDMDAEETTLVESRNYPYLTAQGTFRSMDNEFDWVFSSSPDGFATLMLNMKLFDLRFGETIIIYPQADSSFFYDQLEGSPNDHESFEEFKKFIRQEVKNEFFSPAR